MYLLVVQIFHGGSRWSKVTRKQYPLSNDCIGGTLGSLIPNTKYIKYTKYIPNIPIIYQIHQLYTKYTNYIPNTPSPTPNTQTSIWQIHHTIYQIHQSSNCCISGKTQLWTGKYEHSNICNSGHLASKVHRQIKQNNICSYMNIHESCIFDMCMYNIHIYTYIHI